MLTASHNGEVCKAVSLGPLIKKFCINVPEHDLLFVAAQVARAAGLKQPANSASAFRRVHKAGQALMTLIQDGCIRLEDIPADERDQRLRTTTVIFTESESYQMLLRGSAPQSEPFRKWVTEEVLPTIRKTGSYNAEAIVI